MAAKAKDEPKRHHFVPRCYLRGFSDHKKRVRMYARASKQHLVVTSVNNAAVESGFYTLVEESGEQSLAVEHVLGLIEGLAKTAIARMVSGQFPPTIEDRSNLSLFMALQVLRTPEERLAYEAMVDHSQKAMFEGWTPEYVRERMKEEGIEPTDEAVAEVMDVVENPDNYRFVPHQNEHIKVMLKVAVEAAPVIAARTWLLGQSTRASFITSDHPVVLWSEPSEETRFKGIGIETAEQVYFPLDRRHVLALALPHSRPDGKLLQLTEDNVLFVNHLEADHSFKWVYQHPEDDLVHDLIPDKPKPLMEINQTPIFAQP
jgi:hypothetical protein